MESTCIRIHMGLPSRARLPSSIRILLMTDETPQGERGREAPRRARRARRRRRRDKKALAKLGLQGYFSPSLPPSLSLSSLNTVSLLFWLGTCLSAERSCCCCWRPRSKRARFFATWQKIRQRPRRRKQGDPNG